MDPEDGLETRDEGVRGQTVALVQEVVVTQPAGQRVVMYHPPASLPHL